jgi:hypothetical protein
MRDYCLPMLSTQGGDPMLAMAWGVFGDKRQREFLSKRRIANEFGLAPTTVWRDMQRLRKTGDALFKRAVDRLTPMFARQALVP